MRMIYYRLSNLDHYKKTVSRENDNCFSAVTVKDCENKNEVSDRIAKKLRFVDIDDQVEACRRIFASDTQWTVVRGSNLEEGESQGLPVWSEHIGDPILESNLTRRIDFAAVFEVTQFL